jgi:prostamide/prostaglandin F2alpha synthase
VFCREHAVRLHRDRHRFEEAGARLAVIGQGTHEEAAEFRRAQGVDLPLLADDDRRSYRAAGARTATFSEVLGPRVIARALKRSRAAGVRQGRIVGRPGQLGGALVVAPDASIAYAHLSEDSSDLPPSDEVLEAARAASAATRRADSRSGGGGRHERVAEARRFG